VEDFICNTCRFDKKTAAEWTIEGPRKIEKDSVISANHYTLLNRTKAQLKVAQKAQLEK
jgi:NADH-quinone oxidoreductase subunit G